MKYIFRFPNWQKHIRPTLLSVYKIDNFAIAIYGNIIVYCKNYSFNITNSLDAQLQTIHNFYEALNNVDDDEFRKLLVAGFGELSFEMYGGEEMGDYYISNYSSFYDDEDNIERYVTYEDKVTFKFERGALGRIRGEEVKGSINNAEFYLLIQIYFGLYKDEAYREYLENNEKQGKYEDVKDLHGLTGRGNEVFYEYLKLNIIRRDITGAFPGLEIEKIYDNHWSEEKQRACIAEVNEAFGEEVVVEDDSESM